MTCIASPAAIGLRLYQLRTERGWPLRLVADRLGVGLGTYCNWECGVYYPLLPHAFAVAEFYGMTVLELFGE